MIAFIFNVTLLVPAAFIVLALQARVAWQSRMRADIKRRLVARLGAAHALSLLVFVLALPALLMLLAYAISIGSSGDGTWPIALSTTIGPEADRTVGRLAVLAAAAWGALSAWGHWRWQYYCAPRLAQPELARALLRPIPIVLALCGLGTIGIWHELFLG